MGKSFLSFLNGKKMDFTITFLTSLLSISEILFQLNCLLENFKCFHMKSSMNILVEFNFSTCKLISLGKHLHKN